MAENIAEYQIRVTRTGDGAAQTVAEFSNVVAATREAQQSFQTFGQVLLQTDNAFKAETNASRQSTAAKREAARAAKEAAAAEQALLAAKRQLTVESKNTAAAFKGLGSTMLLLGGSQAPAATAQLLLMNNALTQLRNNGLSLSKALGVGLVAGASIFAVDKAIGEFQAMREAQRNETATIERNRQNFPDLVGELERQVELRLKAGAIEEGIAATLREQLRTARAIADNSIYNPGDINAAMSVAAQASRGLRENTAPGTFDAQAGQRFLDSVPNQLAEARAIAAFQNAAGRRTRPFAGEYQVGGLINEQFNKGNISLEQNDATIDALGQQVKIARITQATQDASVVRGIGAGPNDAIKERYKQAEESVLRFYTVERELAEQSGADISAINAQEVETFKALQKEKTKELSLFHQTWAQFGELVTQQFASSLASTIVSAFREGRFEARKFFADLTAQIAQLAIQLAIIAALKSTGLAIFGAATGGMFGASGVKYMAGGGVAGTSEVSGATYFPDFNVVAGEAGREVMTVLARPRMMSIGGMAAQVGNVGASRLAIVNFQDLAARFNPTLAADGTGAVPSAGGGGGQSIVRVDLAPGLRASIVQEAVAGAVQIMPSKMREHGDLNRSLREQMS